MGDVIGVAALLGIPFATFIWLQWRREEQDRRRRQERPPDDPDQRSPHSHWGGMGRPGRGL